MADLEITFSTRAELEGANKFAADLEEKIGKMKAAGKETSELTAQHARLTEAIAKAEPTLKANESATAQVTEESFKYRDALKGLAFELLSSLGFWASYRTRWRSS